PTVAPWGSMTAAVEYARRVRPERVILIHDFYLSEFGRARIRHMAGAALSNDGIEVLDLDWGQSLTLWSFGPLGLLGDRLEQVLVDLAPGVSHRVDGVLSESACLPLLRLTGGRADLDDTGIQLCVEVVATIRLLY